MADLLQTVAEVILNTLRTGLEEAWGIASYYNGDPGEFPVGALPAICLVKQNAKVGQDSTQLDKMDSQYLIKLIMNKEEDFNAPPDQDLTQSKMERIIEGRDYTTGYYLPQSLMGTLRQNFTLGNRVLANDIEIRYGITDRGDLIAAEANVLISVTEYIQMYKVRT